MSRLYRFLTAQEAVAPSRGAWFAGFVAAALAGFVVIADLGANLNPPPPGMIYCLESSCPSDIVPASWAKPPCDCQIADVRP
jgi:hypothetical protein